jgi:CRISPR system Cascade subunit CasB
MSDKQEKFVEHLAGLDAGALAVLRRSLAKEPGKDPRAFPFVEPFVAKSSFWTRQAYYLLAGLFASGTVRAGKALLTEGEPLGKALFRLYEKKDRSPSVEQRFIALLDADEEELPHRLRQVISLLKGEEISLDWAKLLQDIEHWGAESRWVQECLAREFYGQVQIEEEVTS